MRWNRFVEALRRELGQDVQYFKGAEVQERGALHFHVLVRFQLSRGGFFSTTRLRALAIHHGFGHSVDVDPVNDERAGFYVAKYVSKSCTDRANMPWVHRTTGEVSDGNGRYRCWTASRHWGDTMASIRGAQAAWWADQRATAGAPEAPSGALLDSNSQSYESGLVETGIGGCH